MNTRLPSLFKILLALVLFLTMGLGGATLAANAAALSLKDGDIELLADFSPDVYVYAVTTGTWADTLTLTVDDAQALVYSNAGTGVTGGGGVFSVNLAPLGNATGITVLTGGKTYFINTRHKPITPSAEITSFSFTKADNPGLTEDIIGKIDNERQTIYIDAPLAFDGALLKASFAHNGVALRVNAVDQESGLSVQRFGPRSNPLYYLVTQDSLDAVYNIVVRYAKFLRPARVRVSLKRGRSQPLSIASDSPNPLLFTSSNPAILTVDDTGTVHAIKSGTAIVTVQTNDSAGLKTALIVTVTP